jgi:hypothetical protein
VAADYNYTSTWFKSHQKPRINTRSLIQRRLTNTMYHEHTMQVFRHFLNKLDPKLLIDQPIRDRQAVMTIDVPTPPHYQESLTFSIVNFDNFKVVRDPYWHRIGIHAGPAVKFPYPRDTKDTVKVIISFLVCFEI